MGGQGPQDPGQGQPAADTTKPKQDTPPRKKNTPRQPNQEGRGTAETPAQHARPDSTPEPGKAGNKRGAGTNTHTSRRPSQEWRGVAPTTHPRTAAPTKRCRRPRGTGTRAHTHPKNPPRTGGAHPKSRPENTRPHRTPEPGTAGCRQSAHATTHVPYPQPRKVGCRPKPKPNRKHRKFQPAKEGRHHKPYPHTPAQDPNQDCRGYRNPHPTTTRTQTQAPQNSRKPSVQSPGTEAARAMQLTQPNEIRRPGVRLHPKACAAFGLEAEPATPKHLGTLVPRTCKHALGTGYARKFGEPPGFRPKEGTCASTGAHPPWRDKHVTLAAISPPGVAWGRFVGGHQSGLAGCKLPPLYKRGGSSCLSQRQRQREPWGASSRPSAPTYLPTYLLVGGPSKQATCQLTGSPGFTELKAVSLPRFPLLPFPGWRPS